MFKNRIMLGAIVGSAALVPLAGMTALASSPAGAAKPKGITCSTLSGKVNSSGVAKINLSGCTGNTGGSGKSKGSATASSGTIKWKNGKSTTSSEAYTSGSGCPGSDVTEVISGNVTADSTGSTAVGAALSGTVCYNTATSKLSLKPGTKFKFAA
jgi:hypothetical protein